MATYEPYGFARITVHHNEDGVGLVANRDGLISLARLCEHLAGLVDAHIHLTPSLQLTPESLPLVVSVLHEEPGAR